MTKTTYFNSPLVTFGLPILLIFIIVFYSQTAFFASNIKMMSLAMTLDLLLSVPLVYFFLIRRKNIPKTTVIPVFLLGIIIASFIIPKENQQLLQLAKTWVLPFVEIGILSYVSFKVYKTIRLLKEKKTIDSDFFTVVKNVCSEIVPKNIVHPLASEIAVFYYGFFNWKKHKLRENEFTYHKNTSTQATLGALIFLIPIETVALHMLIVKWNPTIAWVLTIISIYSGFQIFGFLKSLSKRPATISKDTLKLRYGILCEATIDIQDIESIETTSKEIEQNKQLKYLSPLGSMEGHNLIIHLKRENILTGLFGTKKKFKSIALHIDEKTEFKYNIESLLKQ